MFFFTDLETQITNPATKIKRFLRVTYTRHLNTRFQALHV